ncbi:MAG: AtpZ/AtpI family protein [Candidatus Omnitrophica bacterium]|nr:AtpZ/AtpI family protein [Candidatus Omnitrophota bacterium]
MAENTEKKALYRQIKILGMIFFIPVLLAACPIGGFFLGDYLKRRFDFPAYIILVCLTLGFFAGILETIRIVKLVTTIDNKEKQGHGGAGTA